MKTKHILTAFVLLTGFCVRAHGQNALGALLDQAWEAENRHDRSTALSKFRAALQWQGEGSLTAAKERYQELLVRSRIGLALFFLGRNEEAKLEAIKLLERAANEQMEFNLSGLISEALQPWINSPNSGIIESASGDAYDLDFPILGKVEEACLEMSENGHPIAARTLARYIIEARKGIVGGNQQAHRKDPTSLSGKAEAVSTRLSPQRPCDPWRRGASLQGPAARP